MIFAGMHGVVVKKRLTGTVTSSPAAVHSYHGACPAVCEACGACLCSAPAAAPATPRNTVFAGSVPSYGEAHRQLRQFAAAWRAAGQPPLTALSFDVARAFDNVDVAKVKLLLEEAVLASPGWDIHRAKETVKARGRVVTKCVPTFLPARPLAHPNVRYQTCYESNTAVLVCWGDCNTTSASIVSDVDCSQSWSCFIICQASTIALNPG